MRLLPVCLPLVLAPLIVAGQQAQPTTSPKPAQKTAIKQTASPSPHKTAKKHRTRHHLRKAAARKNAKHAGLCADSQFSADVIMGTEVRHVCLDKSQLAGGVPKAKPAGQMKVDVINGSATDTQYFSDSNQESARNQTVVVDVESSDTRFAGGNKSPVVTGVASSSPVDATSASSGGQPVTRQVSPRPKRPAYEPDGH